MPTRQPLYIHAPALGPDELTALRTALEQLADDSVSFELTDDRPDRAHLLVVDEEHPDGQRILHDSRPGQVKLVFAPRPRAERNLVAVAKPVAASTLKALLDRLFAKMSTQLPAPAAEPPTRTSTPTAPASEHDPGTQRSLFDVLLQAKQECSVLRIRRRGEPDVFVDGLNRSLASAGPLDRVRALFDTPGASWETDVLAAKDFAVLSSGLNIATLYNTLWSAGVHCSQGHLLPGHRTDSPIRLRAWPNFTRGEFRPDHLKLAAVLAREAMTLDTAVERTGVAREEAINFYNAAYAVDLVEMQTDPGGGAARTPRPTRAGVERRGLLARIAQRLSLRR